MNSTNGVTAKFLDLLREKVERKKYELKREEELTVDEVRKWVISSETGSANRAFVHLTRSVFPKEERAELVETGTADALVLHSSWSETGVDWLDALENCFSWDINSLCVDLFTTVYETEEQPEPIRKRPENDLTDDECQQDLSLHVTDGVKEELELESVDGGNENDVSENLTFEKTQNEEKENTSVDENERSGSAENTNISCTENVSRTSTKHPSLEVKMPSSFQSDEVTMGRKITETSRQENLSPLSGEELFSNNPSPSPGTRDEVGGNLNVDEDTLAFFSDDEGELDEKGEFGGVEETDGVEQEKEEGANHTEVDGAEPNGNSQAVDPSMIGELSWGGTSDVTDHTPSKEIEKPDFKSPETDENLGARNDSDLGSAANNDVEENKLLTVIEESESETQLVAGKEINKTRDSKTADELNEETEIALNGNQDAQKLQEVLSGDNSRDQSRSGTPNTSRSHNMSAASNYSVKSWKSFIPKFKRVFLIVNLEKIDEIVSNMELINILAIICNPSREISRGASRISGYSSDFGLSMDNFPILELVQIPQVSEKFESNQFYSFFQTSFYSLQKLGAESDQIIEQADEESENENAKNEEDLKSVQDELLNFLFKCCDKRRWQLFKTELDHAARPQPEVTLDDSDWLMQLARAKWSLDVKMEALFIHEVGVNIRVFINGNLDEKNYDCIREHCDWRKELDDKDRAIGLLLDLIETKRKSHSEDNRLFSPLYSELGDLYEKNGQLAEATESYFKALRVETVNHGTDHPDVAFCQNNIGRSYHKRGDNSEAMKFLHRAQKTREFYFGQSDLRSGEVFLNIGDCHLANGHGMKALEFFHKSLEARSSQLSVEADTEGLIGQVLKKIGDTHLFRCDFREAISFYEQATNTFGVNFQPTDSVSLESQHSLAKALHSYGMYEDAHNIYKALIQSFQFQRNDQKTIAVLEDLGLLYQERGEFNRAKRTFLRVTELRGD